MNEAIGAGGPSFGLGVLLPATALLLIVAMVAASRMRGMAARFVIGALWLRYVFGAFHIFMFRPIAAGMSGNALASVAVVGIGLMVIRVRHLALKALVPVYVLIALIILSGAFNDAAGRSINGVVKYAYFMVVMIAVFEALRQEGGRRFMGLLIWAFAPLLLFQWLSIALGLPKGSETGDGLVWIGGFNHEAAFSVALFTAFLVGCLARGMNPVLRLAFVLATVIGVFLAGYRTVILAMAPLALVSFWAAFTHMVPRDQRGPVAVVALVIAVVGLVLAGLVFRERFADLATFLADPSALIKPPRDFTQVDRQVMSGRPLIWSQYLYAYAAGTPVQHLFGFGPDSWADAFDAYPHNTLISTLYELGALGAGAMLLLWSTMAALAFRARRDERLSLVAAHLSFFLLNFATMPFWLVEGLALYAVLCGYTLFSARAAANSRRVAESDSIRARSENRAGRQGIRRPPRGILHNHYSRR